MSDSPQPQRTPMKGTHLTVVIVWFAIAGWLMTAMVVSVVDAVFYGDGPLTTEQAQGAGDEAPEGSTRPTP